MASPPPPEMSSPVKMDEPSVPPPSTVTLPKYLKVAQPLANVYNRFSSWRESLELPNPGTVENLQKEVRSTLLTNFFFDGARADLSKSLSVNPAFQVTHSFALGSQTNPPSYNFGAVFANNNVFLQGGMDNEGNVNGRFNLGWTGSHVTKVATQLSSEPGHSMLSLEHDYQGRDYSLNVKAINPSPVEFAGIYTGSYLQSITKNIALGFESVHQVQPQASESQTSYLAKYTSTDRSWIATAQVQPAGIVQTTYWQKLSDKVEVAADLQLLAAPGRRDALATIGAKYDLRMASFKAQVDSSGKVSAFLEQRFAPTFAFLVTGEIDHFKNAAKVGVGVMIESSSLTPEEMGMTQSGMPMPPQ